jgi:hypothetical protein
MDIKNSQKSIIMLLLLNKNNAFNDAYSLTKALSRWFNIIEFNILIDEMIEEKLIERHILNQIGNYSVTSNGLLYFSKNKPSLLEDLIAEYSTQSEVIHTLYNNVKSV